MTIIDDNRELIKKSFGLENEEQYNLATLWTLGTPFLKHAPDMEVFRFFGMLGFISPEENTGKSTALETIARLSYESRPLGIKTAAAVLDRVKADKDKKGTFPFDELQKLLGVDDQMDNLFNLGYMWHATIERMARFSDEIKETSAFFPKVFAALSANKIQPDTLSRCILFTLYPHEEYTGYIDLKAFGEQNSANMKWAEDKNTIETLMKVKISRDDTSFMHTRRLQILTPILAIAKTISEEWYQEALKACEKFVSEDRRERFIGHQILLALYRIKELKLYNGRKRYKEGNHIPYPVGDDKFIWTGKPFMDLLVENGIPTTIRDFEVSKYLKDYDPYLIYPRQMNRYGANWNGYPWDCFRNAFKFITKEEKEQVKVEATELGIVDTIDMVDTVDSQATIASVGPKDAKVPLVGKGTTHSRAYH